MAIFAPLVRVAGKIRQLLPTDKLPISCLPVGVTEDSIAAGNHGHEVSAISDSGTTGRAVVVAETQAEGRTALGLGTAATATLTTSNTDTTTGRVIKQGDSAALNTLTTTGPVGVGVAAPAGGLHAVSAGNDLQIQLGHSVSAQAGRKPTQRWRARDTADTANRFADIKLDPDSYRFILTAPSNSVPSIDALSITSTGAVELANNLTVAGSLTTTANAGFGGPAVAGRPVNVVGAATAGANTAAVLSAGVSATAGSAARVYLSGTPTAPTTRGVILEAVIAAVNSGGNAHDFVLYVSAGSAAPTERLRATQTGVVRPGADNTQSLGEASFRWSTVFAGTDTINTSDAVLKTVLRDFSDAELDAIGDCRLGVFQWLDAVDAKGTAARLHPGVIAQQIMSAFESHGIDPLRYAPICRDRMKSRIHIDSISVWKKRPVMVKEIARDERIEIIDGVPTVVINEREVEVPKTEMRQLIGADGRSVTEEVQARDEAGELLFNAEEGGDPIPVMVEQPVLYPCPVDEDYLDFEAVFEERDAGWRYGIRYSQLLIMLAAHERRERARLAARVAELEQQMQ